MVWIGLIVAIAPILLAFGLIYWFYRSYRNQRAETRRIHEAGPEAVARLKAWQRAEGRKNMITLAISFPTILIIAIPLMLWTSISSLVITAITVVTLIVLQLIRRIWEYQHSLDEQQPELKVIPSQSVIVHTRKLLFNYAMIFGFFALGIYTLNRGIALTRVTNTIDDWQVTNGLIQMGQDRMSFRYSVDDEEHEGRDIVFLGDQVDDDTYTDGQEVRVYYDPDNPQYAALRQQASRYHPSVMFFVAILTLAFSTYALTQLLVPKYYRDPIDFTAPT